MTSGKRLTLTELELEIMKVIWDLDECTVRQVYEALLERKRIAYTTVMTVMNILEEKGHLRKRKEGRAFLYVPAHPQEEVISTMVENFVSKVFDGAARPLVLSLLQDRSLSKRDREEIARILEETR